MQSQNSSTMTSSSKSDLSIVWSKDRYTIQEIINNEYGSFSESKSMLVKIHCMKRGCRCVLKNEQALTLKCVSQVTLVRGVWSKNGSKITSSSVSNQQSSNTGSNKMVNVILTSSNITWFEILNESGQTAPSWTSTKTIIKNKPSSFLVRKDLKCLLPRRTSNDTFQLCVSNMGTINAGTVLNFVQYKEFYVQKGKKSKEMFLIQCCDNNLSNLFIYPDEKCCISPLAGLNSIPGVHNLYSIIQQFQLPLSIRPAHGSLADWLPSATDKSSLRLLESYCGELVFLEPLTNPNGERFFVITPEMMESHQISLGNTTSAHQVKLLEQHSSRVEQFLLSTHPFEGLRYLLRHLTETTNQSATNSVGASSTIDTANPQSIKQTLGALTSASKDSKEPDPIQKSRLDRLFDEIEDIYYYVRTGRFPSHSRSTASLPCCSRGETTTVLVQHHHQPVLTPINSPSQEHQPFPSTAPQQGPPSNTTHIHTQTSLDQASNFTSTRSISWNDLTNAQKASENKPPIPPLPTRVYVNIQNQNSCTNTDTDTGSPVLPNRQQKKHYSPSFHVVNNPSYDENFHTLIPLIRRK